MHTALASPSGRGTSRREGERDRADSSWRNAVPYEESIRWFGGKFVGRIGAVVLWIACGWNRCGEPSQALRASSPGGRAKVECGGSVGRYGDLRGNLCDGLLGQGGDGGEVYEGFA